MPVIDFAALMKIARSLNPRIILELGTAYGNTVANLCRQCPAARIVTVNAEGAEQTGNSTTFSLTKEEIGCVYRAHGFGDRVTQILTDTLKMDLSRHLQPRSVDLAVIDACHDTKYVINDFLKVHPFIALGGLMLLHDTHPSMRGHLFNSYMACVRLREEGFDMFHIENTWWGAWRRSWSDR